MGEPWPGNINNCWTIAGYAEVDRPVVIRSEMEAGAPKVRRRFTKQITMINASVTLTIAEVAAFKAWFRTVLQGGVKRFDFTLPTEQAVSELRFISPPAFTPITDKHFNCEMELEQL